VCLCCGSMSCVVCELYGVQLRPAVGVLVVLWQRVVCCVWVVWCSVETGCWCACCAVAACVVLCVSRTVFSWDRLLVCLLCCGSVWCVVCEWYGVQLRPAVGVLVVLWQHVVCCVWVVRCSFETGCWCACCAVAACRVLCVNCTVFSWDRLLVCLLCRIAPVSRYTLLLVCYWNKPLIQDFINICPV